MHLGTRLVWLGLGLLLLLASPALASVESELAFHRGVVAYGEDDFAEAERQFKIVLQADAEDTVALHYLGLVAEKRKDHATALQYYDQALAIDPEDTDVMLDRGIALLEAGRLPEAQEAFSQVVALEPDRARAHLFLGIATYRLGAYQEAVPHFERAAALDPGVRTQARYYTGLSNAFMGDLTSAETAFGDVESQSPQSPMGRSAQNLRRTMEQPAAAEARRWEASLTAGMEYDSNPLIIGDIPTLNENSDWRGVIRPQASIRIWDNEKWSLRAGYDGYLSFHIDDTEVNLNTQSAWTTGRYLVNDRVSLAVRYDYAYTMIGKGMDPFRHLHRVTPTVGVSEGDWGHTSAFYQYQYQDFKTTLLSTTGPFLNRDGDRNLVGLNQFFFMPEPFTFARVGILGDWLRTDGTEWSYNGFEASAGAGYNFPFDIALTWLYRFVWRDFRNASLFTTPTPFRRKRDDRRHVFTVELAKGLGEHWEVSLGGAFTWSNSDVQFYDYDRQVGGAYVTYTF